jgi:CubicO group peptidase (beta-lactamase class C family)
MQETAITLTPELSAHLAQAHVGITEVKNWDLPTLAGAGALRSTAADMLKFAHAAMLACASGSGGGAESPLRDAFRLAFEPRSDMGPKMKIGLGWIIQDVPQGKIYWHNGGTGGYRSFLGVRADGSLGVVVLTNSSSGVDDIGMHVLADQLPFTPRRAGVRLEPALLDRYTGRYQLAPGSLMTVWHRGRHLFAQLTGQAPFFFRADSPTNFRCEEVGAELIFEAAGDGGASALTLGQGGRDQRAPRLEDATGTPPR